MHLTLTACFAVAVGVCLFLFGVRLFARKHSLASISTSTIRALAPGRAAISGKAIGPNTLSAPITGQKCYIARTTVWQQSKSGAKAEWTKVAEQTLHLPFFIEDATGQLLVEPLGAEFDLHQILREEYSLPSSPSKPENVPPSVHNFLVGHGIPVDRPTRIEEHALQPETPLMIAGTVSRNPGVEVRPLSPVPNDTPPNRNIARPTNGDFLASAVRPEIVKLSGGPAPASTTEMTQQGKIAAALNRAGMAGPEGWTVASVRAENGQSEDSHGDNSRPESALRKFVAVKESAQLGPDPVPEARSTARDQIKDQTKDGTKDPTKDGARVQTKDRTNNKPKSETVSAFDLSPALALIKGANNAPFRISCQSPPAAAISLGWACVTMVVGGTGLTILGIYLLLFGLQLPLEKL